MKPGDKVRLNNVKTLIEGVVIYTTNNNESYIKWNDEQYQSCLLENKKVTKIKTFTEKPI